MTVWLWLAGLLFLHTIFGVFLAACISYFDMLVSNRVSDYAHNKWNCLDERVYTLCSACVFVCVCLSRDERTSIPLWPLLVWCVEVFD